MIKNNFTTFNNKTERIIFYSGFIFSFIGISTFRFIPAISSIVLFFFIAYYLAVSIVELFNNKNSRVNIVTLFLIAQTILTVIFAINQWPMRSILGYYNITFILCVLFFLFIRNNMPDKQVCITRLLFCFMLAGSPIWLT